MQQEYQRCIGLLESSHDRQIQALQSVIDTQQTVVRKMLECVEQAKLQAAGVNTQAVTQD
jgi:hypothetical protein